MRSCGPNLIKWFIWVYNVDVDKKLWGLTLNWPQLTFSPIQLIFRSTVQLTGQKFDSRLETWYGQTYESNMKYESQFEHLRSKNPCANSNPNFGLSVQDEVLSWANPNLVLSPRSLVRKVLINERENFGVQHIVIYTRVVACTMLSSDLFM